MDLRYENNGRFSMHVMKNGARLMECSAFHDPTMFWRSAIVDLPYENSGRFSMLAVQNGARLMKY